VAAAVAFDIGNVFYDRDPRIVYERLIRDDEALDALLRGAGICQTTHR
jgi:2-haloacid dehalogenase